MVSTVTCSGSKQAVKLGYIGCDLTLRGMDSTIHSAYERIPSQVFNPDMWVGNMPGSDPMMIISVLIYQTVENLLDIH